MFDYLILLLFILSVFAYSKIGYEGTKIYIFLILSFLAVFDILFYKFKILIKSLNKLDLIYLSWVGIILLSSTLGIHPVESILGGSYRHQGVIFFFSLWVIGKLTLFKNEKYKKVLDKVIIYSLLVQGVLVIIQTVFKINLLNGRAIGTLGEPNAVAGFFILGIYFFLKDKKKISYYSIIDSLILLIIFIATVLTKSRIGILSFCLVTILSFFSLHKLGDVKKGLLFLLFGLIVTLSLILINRPVSEFENRLLFWKLAISQIQKKPILGFGAESGEEVFNIAFKENEMPLYELIVDRSHNIIIDVILWSGLLGLSVFIYWIYKVFILLILSKETLKIYSIIGFLIFSFLQPLGVIHWLFFILIINW